jgi:hypothetical protein
MGISDRLKDLKDKAAEAAAEHSEQIHGAVEKAATSADAHTGGKYTERIQAAGAKAGSLVESLKAAGGQGQVDGSQTAQAQPEDSQTHAEDARP